MTLADISAATLGRPAQRRPARYPIPPRARPSPPSSAHAPRARRRGPLGRSRAAPVHGPPVLVPVAPPPHITGRELPVPIRMVDALEEPLGLLPPGYVQHDLDNANAAVGQVPFPVVDLPVAPLPDFFPGAGHPFRGQQLRMHPDDEHLLVVGAVEDADPAPPGQSALVPPEEIVVQLLGGGLFEGTDLHRLRVDAAHHVLDGAVLAGRVESLQHQEHAVRVLRGEPVLILGEEIHAVGKQAGGLLTGYLAGIARMVITAQPDGAARRHHERLDEVGHEAKTFVHSPTMPYRRLRDTRGTARTPGDYPNE